MLIFIFARCIYTKRLDSISHDLSLFTLSPPLFSQVNYTSIDVVTCEALSSSLHDSLTTLRIIAKPRADRQRHAEYSVHHKRHVDRQAQASVHMFKIYESHQVNLIYVAA